jgi:hypothetical protein
VRLLVLFTMNLRSGLNVIEKTKSLVLVDNPIADFSIFQDVTYSLRRMRSPRNKTVMQRRFIVVDFLNLFL